MCVYVVRIAYKAASEQAQLLSFDSAEEMEERVKTALELATVSSVKVFTPWRIHAKVERIEVQELSHAARPREDGTQ